MDTGKNRAAILPAAPLCQDLCPACQAPSSALFWRHSLEREIPPTCEADSRGLPDSAYLSPAVFHC